MRSERSELQGQVEKESQEVRGGEMKKIQGKVVLKADEKKKIKDQVWNEHLATFMEIKCDYVFLVPTRKQEACEGKVERWAAVYSHWR